MEFLGDPYDEMNIEDKKKHALHHYYSRLKVRRCFKENNAATYVQNTDKILGLKCKIQTKYGI